MMLGLTGILKIANAPDMMNPAAGKYVFLVGLAIAIAGIVKMLMNKRRTQDTKRFITYIGIRLSALIAVLLVFK